MNKRNKKSLIALLILVIVGLIGFTLAYFSDSITIGNKFKTKEYGTSVTEVFESPDNWLPGTKTDKILTVKNSGDVDEAVRISFTEEWKSANGTLSGWLHTDGTKSNHTTEEELSRDVRAALINFTNTSDWEKVTENGTDYYYYKYKLAEGEETSEFIDSVTFNAITKLDDTCEEPVTENGKTTITCNSSGEDYDNATYTLTFTIETVQYDKYKEAWGTSVSIANESKPTTAVQTLLSKANGVAVTNYTDGNTKEMYTFTHAATEQTRALTDYRYIGDSPNNFVKFNCKVDEETNEEVCETWRIIGVFTVENEDGNYEQRLKLVRGELLTTNNDTWDSNEANEWSTATLNTYLNGTYFNSLSESAKSMIGNTKYYLGGIKGDYDTQPYYGSTEDMYIMERGIEVFDPSTDEYDCNFTVTESGQCAIRTTSWTGKVALLYPSGATV